MIKLFLSFFIPFITVLFVFWLGGGEFVRGFSLAVTTALALYCGFSGTVLYKLSGGE